MKLYVAEDSSAEIREHVRRAEQVASSRVAYPEARSALARRQREGAINSKGLRRAVSALDRDMGSLVMVELHGGVAHVAGELAERHALRGFDAIHLASALELARLLGSLPRIVSFDERQSEAAVAEGLPC